MRAPVFSRLLLPLWLLRAAAQAGKDAGRAWAVAPNVYRNSRYRRDQNGGWRVVRRRQFRRKDVLWLKLAAAKQTFVASIKVGFSSTVVVRRLPEEGLLANLLHVLEVFHRVRPDARVHVDWTLTGDEIGFRYGKKGDDVWGLLFRSLDPPSGGLARQVVSIVDLSLWGTGRDHLTGSRLQRHRQSYHSTILRWLEIINQRVLGEVDDICTQHFDGHFCIGIHRRVGNPLVADLQEDGRIPSPDSIIQTVESIISLSVKEGVQDYRVFLATDDAQAVELFKNASFGPKLVVRDDVQRTTASATEVHFGDWGRVSIKDAEDVLIDTALLSQCNVLVHASSSVSTVASMLNPSLILVRA